MYKRNQKAHEIIFLNFRTQYATQPKFKFTKIIDNRISSFLHSLKNNPNIMTEQNDKTLGNDSGILFPNQ